MLMEQMKFCPSNLFTENFLNIKLDTQDNVDSELGELSKYYNKSAKIQLQFIEILLQTFYFTALSSTRKLYQYCTRTDK